MKRNIKNGTAALAALLLLSSCAFGGNGNDTSEAESSSELTAEITSAVESTESAVTAAESTEVTTEAPETAELTTEAVTTAEVTTAEVTTEAVTTAAVTTEAVTTEDKSFGFVPEHIEGASAVGSSAAGYDIEVKDGITYVGGIMIANKSYILPESYNPELYVQLKTDWTTRLLDEAQAAFDEMQADFKKENPSEKGFKIQSGYRSYSYQQGLYSKYVKNNGQAAADRFSARAGHSEHQTGLAADINVVGTSTLYESIKDTAEGKWLAANSWRYGFILRYPEGKESVTGYLYEPWHFRYIGKNAAKAVYDSGLTLEEFLGIDSTYKD